MISSNSSSSRPIVVGAVAAVVVQLIMVEVEEVVAEPQVIKKTLQKLMVHEVATTETNFIPTATRKPIV